MKLAENDHTCSEHDVLLYDMRLHVRFSGFDQNRCSSIISQHKMNLVLNWYERQRAMIFFEDCCLKCGPSFVRMFFFIVELKAAVCFQVLLLLQAYVCQVADRVVLQCTEQDGTPLSPWALSPFSGDPKHKVQLSGSCGFGLIPL